MENLSSIRFRLALGMIVLLLGLGKPLFSQEFSGPRGVQVETIFERDAAEIWTLLLNFEAYPNWNPYIRSIQGEAKKGKWLRIHIDGKEKDYDFKAKVLELEPNHAFAWGGGALFFFKARHYFKLEDIGEGKIKFTQGEAWGGIFGKSYGKKVYQEAAKNFGKMNQEMLELLDGHHHTIMIKKETPRP